ncbi:MAG: fructose-1,6-bisphosphatase [Clostridiales bacterium]|nr:fructose-1,6-bisphosphatase [Clostridiales bacterium]
MSNKRFMSLLSKEFPDIKSAAVEIINLSAILSLPKGTEYFFSDLHGEHEAFIHMLKGASGVLKEKIDWLFSDSPAEERDELTTLLYYPEQTIAKRKECDGYEEWLSGVIIKLVALTKNTANKYTRSKVRKRLPQGFAYIMDELLHADDEANKEHYYKQILKSLYETGMSEEFIKELARTVSILAIDRLHIVGDVFDRGAHPDYIMDYLIGYDNVDFQWGNHDILWMGAAFGNWASIANVLRINCAYNNFDMLEIGYGINLRPLSSFALQTYADDECKFFTPKVFDKNKFDPVDMKLAAKMHKAISIIQFKAEAQLILAHPEYHAEARVLLDKIDFEKGTVKIGDTEYPMRDTNFPTVDPSNPFEFTEDEYDVMERIAASFTSSKRLDSHIKFLLTHGSLYTIFNNNLLYHGCIPMTMDGEFEQVDIGGGKTLAGKEYLDYLDKEVRRIYYSGCNDKFDGHLLWYLWSGGKSPLFGKNTITTFQRFFVEDKATHKEHTDPYYKLIANPEVDKQVCKKILTEFGIKYGGHIINGHVPVKHKSGESPVKGGGLLYVIDGGMAKSYQGTTGIAGYTLIYNSRYYALAQHNANELISNEAPSIQVVEYTEGRVTVNDTDTGAMLRQQIEELKELIAYYESRRYEK